MFKFFTLGYLFNMRPGELHFSGFLIFLGLIALFVGIIVFFSLVKKRKGNIYFKVYRALNNFAITNLTISLFLLFFLYEELYIFSARFWSVLWLISMIGWLVYIYKLYKKVPLIKQEKEKEKEFKKYIP